MCDYSQHPSRLGERVVRAQFVAIPGFGKASDSDTSPKKIRRKRAPFAWMPRKHALKFINGPLLTSRSSRDDARQTTSIRHARN
jgi:hypothetical protein